MRKAINDNPVAQIAVVGVLIVVAGLLLTTRVFNKDESAKPAGAGTLAVGTTAAPPTASGTSALAAAPSTAVAGSIPTVLGPPLPDRVTSAQRDGKAVVLLVIRRGGIEDRLVAGAVARLRGDRRLAVFVVPAAQISRFARITQGAGVSRVPALVVVKPGAGTPEARVSYGFRSAESIVQAVRDALYRGPTVPYSPD